MPQYVIAVTQRDGPLREGVMSPPSLLWYDGGVKSGCVSEIFGRHCVFIIKNIKINGHSLMLTFTQDSVCHNGHSVTHTVCVYGRCVYGKSCSKRIW